MITQVPLNFELDIEGTIVSYNLTSLQEAEAMRLSAPTQAYYETQMAALTAKLAATRIVGTAEEVSQLMQEFAYTQGRRDMLMDLLKECSTAYAELAEQNG
jgi:hypothetical protein